MKYIILLSSILVIVSCGKKEESKKTVSVGNMIVGNVIETMDASKYTYAKLKTEAGDIWVAGPHTVIKKGEKLSMKKGLLMKKYFSKTLKREFKEIYFVGSLKGTKGSFHGSHGMMGKTNGKMFNPHKKNPHTQAIDSDFKIENIEKVKDGYTIKELYSKKTDLKDKDIKIRGIVVKYSPNIMKKNWVHIQDGSSNDPSMDLTINTLQEVKEGQQVVVSGKLTLNKDFGYGYKYDLIILDAKIEIEK